MNRVLGQTEKRLEQAYRVDPILYMQLLGLLDRLRDEAVAADADAAMTRACGSPRTPSTMKNAA